MIAIELHISKSDVYNEVAKTTSYTGAKMDNDVSAYERIFTTDEDQQMLDRFWDESANAVTEQLKPFITIVSSSYNNVAGYHVSLSLSCAFDDTLQSSIQSSLFSFFVNMIVSKWYKFTNKGEAESYATEATGMMGDVMRKIYYRKRPKRTIPNVQPE